MTSSACSEATWRVRDVPPSAGVQVSGFFRASQPPSPAPIPAKPSLSLADTFAKYHCNYCEEDVNGLRVRCLECDDFDLCLQVGSRDAAGEAAFLNRILGHRSLKGTLGGLGYTEQGFVAILDHGNFRGGLEYS